MKVDYYFSLHETRNCYAYLAFASRCLKPAVVHTRFSVLKSAFLCPLYPPLYRVMFRVYEVLWYYGAMVLWYYGTIILWYYGTIILWYYGTMVLWYYGTMVLWYYGIMVLWYYGTMTGPWPLHDFLYSMNTVAHPCLSSSGIAAVTDE